MASKVDFRKENYQNDLGQVLIPGDPVMYVGTAWKSAKIRTGRYAGVYYGQGWGPAHDRNVPQAIKITDVPCKRFIWNNVTKKGRYEEGFRTARLPLRRAYKLMTTLDELDGKVL